MKEEYPEVSRNKSGKIYSKIYKGIVNVNFPTELVYLRGSSSSLTFLNTTQCSTS